MQPQPHLTYLCRPPAPTPPVPAYSLLPAAATAAFLTGFSSSILVRVVLPYYLKSFLSIAQLVSMSGTELCKQQELKTTYTLTWPTFD